MTKTRILLALVIAATVVSCRNIGFETTKSGLQYKIFPGGKNTQTPKQGEILKFHLQIYYNDSLIVSTYGLFPQYNLMDTTGRFHDISEVTAKMKAGDSAVCYQFYDTLAKANPYGLPTFMKKGGKIRSNIRIIEIFKDQETAMLDYQKEVDKLVQRDVAGIRKYIQNKNLKVEETSPNVFVEITEKGAGPAADSGKLVGIKYTGYTLEGKYFDSNVDTTKQLFKHGLDTFFFAAKQDGAIAGMLQGITAFNKGGKGRIFIPSMLAYGPQGSPPAIKPFESLIFDVEVVEVKDMPAQPTNPPMPVLDQAPPK